MTLKLEKSLREFRSKKQIIVDDNFMRLAFNVSKLSTCSRLQVGAVLTMYSRPLLTGYNGTPSERPHCIDIFKQKWQDINAELNLANDSLSFEEYMKLKQVKEEHHNFSKLNEVHAEINIIAQAAYRGLAIKDSTLYVTHSPCNDCCKAILSSGIRTVVFSRLYDRETEGLEILLNSGIDVYCIMQNILVGGFIDVYQLSESTGC